MVHRIDGSMLKEIVLSAAAAIERDKQHINDLNVFPVPDGDTGTNMSLTLGAAANTIANLPYLSVGKMADAMAGALLRGARGNSGVITSLLGRGFARAIRDFDDMDGADLASAMKMSTETAYSAVMKPSEGTILTVSRVAAAKAEEAAAKDPSFEYVLEQALQAAQRALPETMNQNSVLKKAGVVDAGAVGYVIMLQAALGALRGESRHEISQPRDKADFSAINEEEITFTYCTEFIVEKNGLQDTTDLKTFLSERGDSIVLVDDEDIIKVHIHTDDPGDVLHEALRYGAFSMVKVENMRLQHTEKIESSMAQEEPAPPEKELGFVAVCSGEGMCAAFREIGVDCIVEGGQTMNPSTQDILRAIESTGARSVCILPNNKNIILTAQQCIPLSSKDVRVIPSRTVPEGISAMIAVNPDGSVDEAEEAMNNAVRSVRTMEITYAVRDAVYDGCVIKQGDFLALDRLKPFGTDSDIYSLLRKLAHAAADGSCEYIGIYYGENVTQEQAEKAREIFEEICPEAEINVLDGGQPVYYYMISVE